MIGRDRKATSGPLACFCLFVFVFFLGGRLFYTLPLSADVKGVPVPLKPLMAQGQNNSRPLFLSLSKNR
jgi:hypothetical protein